jgi:hypothetical protein
MRGMETFTLVPRGPFSLAASIRTGEITGRRGDARTG